MIPGHSNTNVLFYNKSVAKTASNIWSSKRLGEQCEKQLNFAHLNKLPYVKAAEISSFGFDDDGNYCINMPYYPYANFIEYFNRSNMTAIESKMCMVLDVIRQYIKLSNSEPVSKDLLRNKFKSCARNLKHRTKYYKIFNNLLDMHHEITLPVGYCHGDFTLSNMLFSDQEIVLIDFLGTFLESPIQDIVKLRQDTFYKWSLELYNQEFDRKKISMVLDHIDSMVVGAFRDSRVFEYYDLFQFMNLLRILPYAKSFKVISNVEDYLEDFNV